MEKDRKKMVQGKARDGIIQKVFECQGIADFYMRRRIE